LHDRNPRLAQNLANSIGEWAERTEIPQAVEALDSAPLCIVEESLQSEIVTVYAAEKADALRGVESPRF
jgi:hypothetical protein